GGERRPHTSRPLCARGMGPGSAHREPVERRPRALMPIRSDGQIRLMLYEELLERFLLVQPGRRFCDICPAKMLSAPIDDMRSAAERLRATPGFTSAAGQCFNCDRPRTVFGFPA